MNILWDIRNIPEVTGGFSKGPSMAAWFWITDFAIKKTLSQKRAATRAYINATLFFT
jgi:hypothetical protein